MKSVQNLLRVELWSARTSKKIIAAAVVICFFGILYVDWLNPLERQSLLNVLHQAEVIRNASDGDLDREFGKAKPLEVIADERVWTERDLLLNGSLGKTTSMAMLCRRSELRSSTKPEEKKLAGKIREMACSEYDQQMSFGRSVLSRRLGF